MKRRQENVKQHFVPQTYYRIFSDNRKSLKVLDIKREREYISSIDNISFEKYFYDVDMRLFPAFVHLEKQDEQVVDKHIKTHIEDHVGVVLNNFDKISNEMSNLKSGEGLAFDPDNFHTIIQFIIVQLIRTPKFRQHFFWLGQEIQQIMSYQDVPIQLTAEDWTKLVHNLFLFGVVNKVILRKDTEFNETVTKSYMELVNVAEELEKQIYKCGYFLICSEIDKPFITSDNPVFIEWKGESPSEGFGYINIPITPKTSMLFFNREHFSVFNQYHHSIYVIDEKKANVLDNFNLLTTKNSIEKIYSNESYDFKLEKLFINGEIRMKIEL